MMAAVQFQPKSSVLYTYLYSTIILTTFFIVLTPAEITSYDDVSQVQLQAMALNSSTLEVSWIAENIMVHVRQWFIVVSDNHTGETSKTCTRVRSDRRYLIVNNLKTHITYYIALYIWTRNKQCLSWSGQMLNITIPEHFQEPEPLSISQNYSINTKNLSSLSANACAGDSKAICSSFQTKVMQKRSGSIELNGDKKIEIVQASLDQYTTPSQGAVVAEAQRKSLVWWILVVGGAGLAVIIILSAITVLCYRPWRSSQKVEMRKHSQLSKNDSLLNSSHFVTLEKCPSSGITGDIQMLGKVSPLNNKMTEMDSSRKIQSTFSWGSEFDALDTQGDDLYINVDPMADSSQAVCHPHKDVTHLLSAPSDDLYFNVNPLADSSQAACHPLKDLTC